MLLSLLVCFVFPFVKAHFYPVYDFSFPISFEFLSFSSRRLSWLGLAQFA